MSNQQNAKLSHEELDTHHKRLGTHKQSTPRAGEGLSAGAARLGRAALQNHLFELQDAVVVRMLYVGMQVCMLNCGKTSHITDKKRRETQQSYLIVSYNMRRVTCGANRDGDTSQGELFPCTGTPGDTDSFQLQLEFGLGPLGQRQVSRNVYRFWGTAAGQLVGCGSLTLEHLETF